MKKITLLLLALTGALASAQTTTNNITLGGGVIIAKFDTTASQVTMTLTGPSSFWFAVGLNTGTTMMSSGGKDCLVYTGTGSPLAISDRNFSGMRSQPLVDSSQNWTVTSNTVSGSTRTIVANRALTNSDVNDYQFSNSAGATFNILWAVGDTANVADGHANRGTGSSGLSVLSNDTFYLAGFKMYPNPADEILAVELPQGTDVVTVKMYDVLGKQVLIKEITALQNKLDITTLKAGSYIVKVIGVDKEYTTNLVVQ